MKNKANILVLFIVSLGLLQLVQVWRPSIIFEPPFLYAFFASPVFVTPDLLIERFTGTSLYQILGWEIFTRLQAAAYTLSYVGLGIGYYFRPSRNIVRVARAFLAINAILFMIPVVLPAPIEWEMILVYVALMGAGIYLTLDIGAGESRSATGATGSSPGDMAGSSSNSTLGSSDGSSLSSSRGPVASRSGKSSPPSDTGSSSRGRVSDGGSNTSEQLAGVGGRQANLISLGDDEKVLGNVVFYWLHWSEELFGAALLFLFGLSWMAVGDEFSVPPAGGIVPIVLAVGTLFLVYRAKERSGCLVTNKRIVLSEAGLLANQTKEVRLSDIRSIMTAQSGMQSVLGTGSVKVDTGAGQISIGARNSNELAKVIRREKNKQASG